jgi:geranylgeranyl diphosphate synthase type II
VPKTADSQAAHASSDNAALGDLLPTIERALRDASEFGDGCPPRLAEAMRYALLAPGKRLRPALVLMAAEACGGAWEQALPGAVAVEMIHAYSLIHDDLPAMDDDDLRRGRPTVHIQFDEATAILAGDALLAQAFCHLSRQTPDPVAAAEAVRVLSYAAGPCALAGGQFDDLQAESRDRSDVVTQAVAEVSGGDELAVLEAIHRRKTGALIAASLDLGVILSGGDPSQRETLGDYAREIGLAFQVVDDLLDLTAEDAALGKRVGKDAERGKLTYPGLLGIEGARRKAEELVKSAERRIAVFGSAGWRLIWLANYVLERSH